MSQTPETNNSLPKESIFNKKVTRRFFSKSLAVGAGLVAAAPALRAFAAVEKAVGVSPEAAEAASAIDWSTVPLVENEPPSVGTIEIAEPLADILNEIRMVSGDGLNMRDTDDINTVIEKLPKDAMVRIFPEADGAEQPVFSGYPLSRANRLVMGENNESLLAGTEGRIAAELTQEVTVQDDGSISFYDPEQKLVSIPISTPIVRFEQRDLSIPEQKVVRTAESLVQSFDASAIGGGASEAEAKAKGAWGNSKLTVFQRAVAYAALDEGLKQVDRAGVVDVDSILGEGAEVFQLSVHHGTEHLDVISRVGSGSVDDKFVITRVAHNGATNTKGLAGFEMNVSGIGVTTWEGLVEAYGDQAITYAQNATALEETQDGIEEISGMEQAGVFLAGVGETGVIAPKLDTKSQPDSKVIYERVGGGKGTAEYRAVMFSTDPTTKKEVQTGEARFVGGQEYAEWVTPPEEADLEAFVDIYATVYSLDAKEVREQLVFEQKKDYKGNPYLVMLHGKTPLMVRAIGQENSTWEEATPEINGALNEKQIKVYTSVDGAEPYSSEVYQKTYAKFNGLAPSGSFLQSALQQYTLADRFAEYVAQQGESLRVHTSFFHGIIEGDLGANASRETVDDYVDYHIELLFSVLDKVQDRIPEIEMIFANEPKWKNGPGSGWEESPLYSAYGEEWPVEIFVRLYQAAQERGYDLKNKLSFMFNDYGIEIDSPDANEYTKADMVRQDIETLRNKIAVRLNIAPEDVPMSVGFQGWAAFGQQAQEKTWLINGTQLVNMERTQAVNLIADNIDSFADVLDPTKTERPINATEIGTYGAGEDEQAEYVSRWAAGIKQSGRADSIGFWTPLRDPSIKSGDDMSLFDVQTAVGKRDTNGDVVVVGFKPRKAYYALNTALYN